MFGGEYGLYVLVAYAGTALVLGALIWVTVAASIRARRELDRIDRKGKGR